METKSYNSEITTPLSLEEIGGKTSVVLGSREELNFLSGGWLDVEGRAARWLKEQEGFCLSPLQEYHRVLRFSDFASVLHEEFLQGHCLARFGRKHAADITEEEMNKALISPEFSRFDERIRAWSDRPEIQRRVKFLSDNHCDVR